MESSDDAATDAQGLDEGGLFWLAGLAQAGDRLSVVLPPACADLGKARSRRALRGPDGRS